VFSQREEYNTPEYKAWRYAIFARDKWICQLCQRAGQELNAHHIKRWVDAPHLRFAISNGITLCRACHDNTVTGREHEFEGQFRKLIEAKEKSKPGRPRKSNGNNSRYNGGSTGFSGPKWRPRNPRLRF
jgi:5-methylcytosine-specific restriction endonuclease McrA